VTDPNPKDLKAEEKTKKEGELSEKELEPIAGGFNPQPDPPGRS
jgi:hypothetical protein